VLEAAAFLQRWPSGHEQDAIGVMDAPYGMPFRSSSPRLRKLLKQRKAFKYAKTRLQAEDILSQAQKEREGKS